MAQKAKSIKTVSEFIADWKIYGDDKDFVAALETFQAESFQAAYASGFSHVDKTLEHMQDFVMDRRVDGETDLRVILHKIKSLRQSLQAGFVLMEEYDWKRSSQAQMDKARFQIESNTRRIEWLRVELRREKARLDWLDLNCSFVADSHFNLGPFKPGQLRELADAGMKADKEL